MGVGVAILILAGLTLFGSGKKEGTQNTAAPDSTSTTTVADSPVSEISTVSNAQVLASEASSATASSSNSQSLIQPVGANHASLQAEAPLPIQSGAPGDGSPSAADGKESGLPTQQDTVVSPSVSDTQPAMLRREHH
jgi:hypothetical protein